MLQLLREWCFATCTTTVVVAIADSQLAGLFCGHADIDLRWWTFAIASALGFAMLTIVLTATTGRQLQLTRGWSTPP